MDYRVKITKRAISDAREAHDWIFQDSPERALSWFRGLLNSIDTLSMFPQRCALAQENGHVPIEVRQLLYGKGIGVYRVLFQIVEEDKTVIVLRVRHSARTPLTADELQDLD